MMIVINFAEEHKLLNAEQLEDARSSLRTLFLRTTGEETMLRKIIGILRVNKSLNQTFSEMSNILMGVDRAQHAITEKLVRLKHQFDAYGITVEENQAFTEPFMNFSNDFARNVETFQRQMRDYRDARESEARAAHVFRLAKEARARIKQRFENKPDEENEHEEQVRNKVYQSFDYAEAQQDYTYSQRSAESAAKEVEGLLKTFHQMCQVAMNPKMRAADLEDDGFKEQSFPDIFTLFTDVMIQHPRLKKLAPAVQELLKLYQHSFGMFKLDFEKFNRAIVPMIENIEDYLSAKEMDEDVRTKQEKLEKIESLIAFIEASGIMLKDGQDYSYPKFSSIVTKLITNTGMKWTHIAEGLLRMKVTAEAELSTQLA